MKLLSCRCRAVPCRVLPGLLVPGLLVPGLLVPGLLVAAAFGGGCQAAAPPEPTALTVMTWNLEWFFDEYTGDNFSDLAKQQAAPRREDWNWRRDAVAAQLAKAAPTIVGLQEIENQRVLYYLRQAVQRNHGLAFRDAFSQGTDFFTEQDVGFLYAEDVAMLRTSRYGQTASMRQGERYHDLSKHLEVVFEIPLGDGEMTEVTVLNLHLRARPKGQPIRLRQARLAHAWLAERIAAGENVIMLGDFNTEQQAVPTTGGSDLAAALGRDTPTPNDDLVDLHGYLPASQGRTHLLAGKQFDRILVSPSLIEDDPQRRDLVLSDVEVQRDLAVRGRLDPPDEHFDHYWKLAPPERDLSDHWPLTARFTIR